MRWLVIVVALGACVPPTEDQSWEDPDPGWIDPGGDPLTGCRDDADCPGQVCARDRACYPADRVRFARVTWTVGGKVATSLSCGDLIELHLELATAADDDGFGFAPVACRAGAFTIDKLPTRYTQAHLGENGATLAWSAPIDAATGEAAIAIP